MRNRSFKLTLLAVFLVVTLLQFSSYAADEPDDWETAVSMMKKGAVQMAEGWTMMHQKKDQKKDLASTGKMIKDGHRTMMESEKTTIRIQRDTMKRGAKMMLDGLQVLKAKKDAGEAEKLMAQGHKMILEAERMMDDMRVEKMMQGSRTMMRGLRMMEERDIKAADKLMVDGKNLMLEAAKIIRDEK